MSRADGTIHGWIRIASVHEAVLRWGCGFASARSFVLRRDRALGVEACEGDLSGDSLEVISILARAFAVVPLQSISVGLSVLTVMAMKAWQRMVDQQAVG